MQLAPTLNTAASSSYFMGGLGTIAYGLSSTRGLWKWYRYGELYTNTDNLLPLAAGELVNAGLPNNLFIKLPALPFFVASIALDIFSDEEVISEKCGDFIEACLGTVPVNSRIVWTPGTSTFTVTCLSYTTRNITTRVYDVGCNALQIGLRSMRVVMRVVDIIDVAFNSGNIQEVAERSVREGGVHIPKCLDALTRNKHAILSKLKKGETVFGRVIEALGGNPKHINESVESLFSYLEPGLKVYQKACATFGDGVFAIVKKGVHDIATMVVDEKTVNQYYNPELDPTNPFSKHNKFITCTVEVISFSHVVKKTAKKAVIEELVDAPIVTSIEPIKEVKPMIHLYDLGPEPLKKFEPCKGQFQSPTKKKSPALPTKPLIDPCTYRMIDNVRKESI